MAEKIRQYVAIDAKSFYASVECVERHLNPLTTNLVVADESRTEKTICLAVSPSLKAHGIPGRARLFEVIRRMKQVNRERLNAGIRSGAIRRDPETRKYQFSASSFDAEAIEKDPTLEISYIVAPPRMRLYEEYSSRIYATYLKYVSSEDIITYVYDGLGRVSKRTVNTGGSDMETTYNYLPGGHGTNSTTPFVQTITQNGVTLTYTYDDGGNISSVSDGSKTISYEYDLLGQLIRTNDPYDLTGGNAGTTWLYTYDQGGNIQIKAAYAYTLGAVGAVVKTDTFSYGDANWKDKLTTFNGGSISYDEIGNPLNNGTWNYSWVDGRRLRAVYKGEYNQPGHDEILFDYNEDGLRTKKTRLHYDESSGSLVYASTEYILHGKNIVHMTSNGHTMHFFYDAQNRPAVVVYDGTPYAFRYNLQGDVIALADNNGNKIVEYKYDVWGRILSTTGALAQSLGMLNPFKYRGYVK